MGTATGNKDIENKDDTQERASQWTELLTQLLDKITGKDVAITYQFDSS